MHIRNNFPAAAFAAPLISSAPLALPDRVDYLVIGAGATGMAFCDTLLHHATNPVSVLMIDQHSQPGGQWMDSYDFVRLHQPSDMYGVESVKLEQGVDKDHLGAEAHRATRVEILDYYDNVCQMLEAKYDFHFLGDTSFDMAQLDLDLLDDGDTQTASDEEEVVGHVEYKLSEGRSVWARKVVDARYLQPDLPVHIPPKFQFDPSVITCVPVNSLSRDDNHQTKYYVIIGAGKTGMDAITYLLQQKDIDPDNILWVVPNEAWITARENIGSCMEFLHECTNALEKEENSRNGVVISSEDFFQRGFLEWEKQGKVYRFDKDILPTKFKDATLSKRELALIKNVKRVVRNGRVESIDNNGALHFADGTTISLPWSSATDSNAVSGTAFVHCSAGAFNYSKQTKNPPPVFSHNRISIQDVYGTPGFCFVGSIIGKLESMGAKFTNAEKNSMCSVPSPDAAQAKLPLGPSGGDVGMISNEHGYVQRSRNLKKWLQLPEMRNWLVGHRLFNLRHLTVEEIDVLVDETWNALEKRDVISKDK